MKFDCRLEYVVCISYFFKQRQGKQEQLKKNNTFIRVKEEMCQQCTDAPPPTPPPPHPPTPVLSVGTVV